MPPAPGLTTGLSQRSQVNLPGIALGHRPSAPCGQCRPVRQQGSSPGRPALGRAAQTVYACVASSRGNSQGPRTVLFSRDPEESDREEQAAAEEAVPRRNVGVNGLLPLLGLQLLNLRLQVGPKASRSPRVIRRFPTEERSAWTQATERVGEATTWPYAVFH